MSINFTHEFYKKRGPRRKGYDVTISIIRSEREHPLVRFGFLVSSLDKIRSRPKYVQISNAIYSGPRIWFKFSDMPEGQCYSIQSNSNKRNMYVAMAMSGEEGQVIKTRWANNGYVLNYDATEELFYIEQLILDTLEDTEVKEK